MSLEISPSVATYFVSFTRTVGAACSWFSGFSRISIGATGGHNPSRSRGTNLIRNFYKFPLIFYAQPSNGLDVTAVHQKLNF